MGKKIKINAREAYIDDKKIIKDEIEEIDITLYTNKIKGCNVYGHRWG